MCNIWSLNFSQNVPKSLYFPYRKGPGPIPKVRKNPVTDTDTLFLKSYDLSVTMSTMIFSKHNYMYDGIKYITKQNITTSNE